MMILQFARYRRHSNQILHTFLYLNVTPTPCNPLHISCNNVSKYPTKAPSPALRSVNRPFRAPWKKKRTMNTCNPAIVTIIIPSITLKLNIRLSVLRTVLKFRFSRVRKYFWLRLMVESWAESLRIDSSRTEVCSGEVPCLEGSCARCSFST